MRISPSMIVTSYSGQKPHHWGLLCLLCTGWHITFLKAFPAWTVNDAGMASKVFAAGRTFKVWCFKVLEIVGSRGTINHRVRKSEITWEIGQIVTFWPVVIDYPKQINPEIRIQIIYKMCYISLLDRFRFRLWIPCKRFCATLYVASVMVC